jgi:Uma2 family endonuclease
MGYGDAAVGATIVGGDDCRSFKESAVSIATPPEKPVTPPDALNGAALWREFDRAPKRLSARDEPTWEVAAFFPRQGHWTGPEYLAFHTNRMVELNDGVLEVLPMPTRFHQLIAQFLHAFLVSLTKQVGGEAYMAPIPVRLTPEKYREPDVVYCRPERVPPLKGYPQGADLVVEVVSEDAESRERDYVTKRPEYARAGITEYWIVDPETSLITVLTLSDTTGLAYRVHGEFRPGETATSLLLEGFNVDVRALFSVGQ